MDKKKSIKEVTLYVRIIRAELFSDLAKAGLYDRIPKKYRVEY